MIPANTPDMDQNYLSRDERLLRKVKEIVETNLKNQQFGVEILAEKMAMSRIQLFRRLHNLTAKNVSQYIWEIRLEYAMKLLQQDVASVAEIAYRVGFRSPAYFNKCFHDFYEITPGELTKRRLRDDRTGKIIKNKKNQNKERGIINYLYFRLSDNVLCLIVLIIVISFFSIKLINITSSTQFLL